MKYGLKNGLIIRQNTDWDICYLMDQQEYILMTLQKCVSIIKDKKLTILLIKLNKEKY